MAEEEKKIFIDEDWKARVEREKEEASSGKPAEEKKAEPEEQAPHQPSFLTLVSDLATQAMFALGVIAPEGSEQVMVDIGHAKYVIDTLMVLRDKTKGNLTPEEEGHLREALSELQRIYVIRFQQAQEQTMRQGGVNPQDLKGGKD